MNSGRPDLSLAGSQINVVSASHRPGSAKRPNLTNSSTSGGHPRTGTATKGASSVNGNLGSGSSRAKGKNTTRSSRTLSQRSDVSSQRSDTSSYRGDTSSYRGDTPGAGGDNKLAGNSKKLTAKDDFLALFESSTYTAKTAEKCQQRPPGTRPAWMTPPGSAHGTNAAASVSKTSAKTGKTSQRAFGLPSGRSSTSVGDIDDHFAVKQNINITTKSQQNKTHTSLLNSRTREDGDLNLCLGDDVFASHPSTKDGMACRSRNTSRSDSNEFAVGGNISHGDAGRNLNSIANNMTSLAMSPGTKASFLGLENSYQNLKPKTPINQVKKSVSHDDRVCHQAAVCIQRWYRRCRAASAALEEDGLKRMLAAKRRELEEKREREREQERERERKERDRVASREEKARQARQRAIEELHRKREEKRLENQRKAEEEIAMLKETGKVGRARKNNVGKKGTKKTPARATGSDSGSSAEVEQRQPATPGGGTCSIDDLFQSTRQKTPTESATDRRTTNDLDRAGANHARPHTPDGATSSRGGGTEAAASEAATNKTTLEDLMETLKKLEEEDVVTSSMKAKNQKPLDWLDELEKPRPQESLEPSTSKDNLKKSSFLTDEKLRSIMTYLDEVETAERLTDIDQEMDKINKALERPALLVPSGEELAQLEQASATASEVTQNMLLQKMELEEKKRSVAMLQKALSQQRELTVRHAKETEREMKQRLQLQKQEHEEAMKRHLSFIDQLIDDKKNLTEKCEKLVLEMKTIYKKYQDQIKTMQESHELKMKKEKELAAASEKLRREKWIEEKTKKIKEMTVRGLEPEIQRLIAKHKAEIKKLKSVEQGEVLAADERAAQRYIKMTEELQDQLASEKEAACARERELARQTYEKQMQQEEEAYQSQRRRLYAEVQEEKERLAQQAMRQRTEIDRLQRQLEDSHKNAVTAMKTEYEQAREEQERRHLAEVSQLREQLALEKRAWEENYMKKKETWLLGKERELKEQVRRERDREIELVIQRLEEDNQAARDECERVAENRIKRIRDKYEKEIEELEKSERQTREKHNTTKAKQTELEGENQRLNVVLKQRDKEIVELKKLLDRLNEERSRVADVIRQEFANRLVATEEENKQVKMEMSELRARHQLELDRAKANIEAVEKAKDNEMEEVHKRVKQAILKKEEVVKQIQEQYQAAVKRADHLEGLLDQQRKQLLRR